MRLLALILIAWLWAVISVQAHQFDAKHCDDAIDTDQLRECLAENLTKSDSWDINKSTNAEGADFLEARLESHDHIACGEKSGHLELVFICSERVPIVFVTGTCRFADHARFGRFNIKIGDNRRQKIRCQCDRRWKRIGANRYQGCHSYCERHYQCRKSHNPNSAIPMVAHERDILSN